ncbi:hypothetical protein [Streptomyces sp. CB01881]|uniref:hypothetical protein n=1 Tax=Streptomyces sp. CB01881 TaxID=2078691 RepID=UPI000CDC6E5A|nr:hypothetical protein [Streptomyces sp. CB01881]AUY51306.1 hypothetical protein C2142_22860 [Streptomyces sp. CB01881]TYC74693.1 hypothetical protein EH183_22835 [Streptomyces sp. CB01881]
MTASIGFKEPGRSGQETGHPTLPGPRGPESLNFVLKGEEFTISGFERQLPEPSSATARGRLVRAGLADPGTALDENGWHAVARAVVHPEAIAAQLRTQTGLASALIEEHVEGATLRSIHARAWLTELIPGLQPRTGQEALPVPDPVVRGVLDPAEGQTAGRPLATVAYEYENLQHLRDHLQQTIVYTRDANPNPYDQSILARRITRAVIAHPCRLEFKDETESINVLVVRDGITRITSAWALLAGDDAKPDEIARVASDLLLAEKPTRRNAAERSLSQRHALGRQEELEQLRGEFLRGLGDPPSDRAVRIGQTLVVPAQIAVGLQAYPGGVLPDTELFDDAVRSILAAVHVEFKGWDAAAQNVEVGSRALRRVLLSNAVKRAAGSADLAEVVDLAVGRIKPGQVPRVFGDRAIPPSPLWRAVYLVHALTRPELYREVKRHAMDIKGTRAMTFRGFAELLGPIVDLPWRAAKKAVLQQARNAWGNGGVLTDEVLKKSWEPVPTSRFTDLVRPAIGGDLDARMTLAVAGGIALITDKLLTRNVGSTVGRTVPFRADVHAVVAGLSGQDNEAGLWLLAYAADRFEPDRQAKNSLTDAQLSRVTDLTSYYSYVDVDLAQPDRVARDVTGVEVGLSQYRVVAASDPAQTEQAEAEKRKALGGEQLSINEQIAQERSGLLKALESAEDRLNTLTALTTSSTLNAFGSKSEWEPLYKLSLKLQNAIYNGGTTIPGTEVYAGDEEYEGDDEE